MLLLTGIIQGIVEGATEFLPVSSTGHLILTGHLLGFTDERAKTFEIVIQLASILAALWVFRRRFYQLIPLGKQAGKQTGFVGWNGLFLLFVVTLPAAIIGFLLDNYIKTHLFTPLTVAIGLGIGGIVLIGFEKLSLSKRIKHLDDVRWKQALAIGCAQVFAMWPGVSRSASTIVGGEFAGLDRKTAVEFSFLAAIPVMIGATGLDLVKSIHAGTIHASDAPLFAVGMISSFLTAIIAIKFFLHIIQNHTLSSFGYYRIAVAILVFVVLI